MSSLLETANGIQYYSLKLLLDLVFARRNVPRNWHGYGAQIFFDIANKIINILKSLQGKTQCFATTYQTNNAPVFFNELINDAKSNLENDFRAQHFPFRNG
ncbi:hypothetical protein CEXT_485921 [Caerostris extrusa]|uniref:Uncharacterized protein n=1 Tax=Caerostris extrusa TaxID=172846 RepID=A0AAV4TER7_CAEEX|nr:hypothetical protein CEXT_485921 [Caerostris extrusa]